MKTFALWVSPITILAGLLGDIPASRDEADSHPSALMQYGTMHEAIGQKQHEYGTPANEHLV
ncbi:MAG: hypothetical protein KDE31_38040 [Caldilineaceae bacterium]|nr:hypothetical protein [Caldilineaceae bacterium]